MMKYGVHLPNFGAFGDARILAEFAQLAEEAGWDGFFIWDHLLFCEPDKNAHVDPWVALTAVALSTERITFGTMVTAVPRRRPWKLARETVSLHNLSGGRLVLGVGLGDPVQWEYGFFHDETDPMIRAEKLDEGLAILQGLWSGETFGFEGKHYHLEPMTFLPKPVRPIPIWVAGYWGRKRPFRRAARYAGVAPSKLDGDMTPTDMRDIIAYIYQHRETQDPFDVVAFGRTDSQSPELATVKSIMEAGATWWVEDVSQLRLGMGWEELWKPWDIAPLRARIIAGPPKA
jgi:alkanesulfonate monooxygenase SsuD/methylene tetrahydromethanopterin reductase-like flavin-dependent oxidoreductase (luciferase family)